MFKKKVYSTILTGVLAFTTSVPSVMANVPAVIEGMNEPESEVEGNLFLPFSDLLEIDSTDEQELFSHIFVSIAEDSQVVFTHELNDPLIEISIGEHVHYLSKDSEEIRLSLSEGLEDETVIQILVHRLEETDHNYSEQLFEWNVEEFIALIQDYDSEELTEEPTEEPVDDSIESSIEIEEDNENQSEDSEDTDDDTTIEENISALDPEEELEDETEVEELEQDDKVKEIEKETGLEEEEGEQTTEGIQDSSSLNMRAAEMFNSSVSPERISNGVNVNYTTIVGVSGFSIDSLPWGTSGYQRVGTTTQWVNQEVRITQETRNGEYVLIERSNELIGWVDRRALRMAQIGHVNHSKVISLRVRVSSGGYSVDTLPWGTPGYQRMTRTSDFINEEVTAVRQTNNGEYVLLEDSNGSLIGWVDHRAISPAAQKITNGTDVNYTTIVGIGGFTVDSLPWGTSGYQRIDNTRAYENQQVKVVQETRNGEYVLIEQEDKLIGWVDRRALRLAQTGNPRQSTTVQFEATLNRGGYTIDSLPWGTQGYQRIDNTSHYLGEKIRVVRQTHNGNYLLAERNGSLLGWIDHRAVEVTYQVGMVNNSFPVDYYSTVSRGGYSLDTLPWGVEGYQRIQWSQNITGETVKVTHEYGSYVLIEKGGTPLGWIDKAALNGTPQRKTYNEGSVVSYSARLKSGYTIDTLPWGVSGHERLSRTQFYENQEVTVRRQTGSYALIQIGSRVFGWVDRKALQLPVVYIDPGHGGSDPGATNGNTTEAERNLVSALILRDILKARNYEVIMSRKGNQFLSLADRAKDANALNPDIFLSIHHNAMGGAAAGTARGIETFIYHRVASGYGQETNRNNFRTEDPRIAESLRLADAIHPQLINRTGMYNRGLKGNNFHVLRETDMPAVLVELGFIDNASDLALIRSRQFQERAAVAMADGIDRYFKR